MGFTFYGYSYKPEIRGQDNCRGVRVGERALVLIFEAQSNEELDSILQRLPLWGLAKWKVTPLETLEGRTGRDRQFIEQLEQSLGR